MLYVYNTKRKLPEKKKNSCGFVVLGLFFFKELLFFSVVVLVGHPET